MQVRYTKSTKQFPRPISVFIAIAKSLSFIYLTMLAALGSDAPLYSEPQIPLHSQPLFDYHEGLSRQYSIVDRYSSMYAGCADGKQNPEIIYMPQNKRRTYTE